MAAFGRERQAQKGISGAGRTRAMADADEPWDAHSAEALTRVYEMAQAEESASRRSRRAPATDKPLRSARAVAAQPQATAPAPAYDQVWLEARFAGIAALLQQALADSNPTKPLAAVDRRLDRLEGRLDCLFNDMSVRLGGPWLELIEEHIKGLAGHFEATTRQLGRLDAVDEQLRQLARALEEHVHWSRTQPVGLRDDAIAAMIDTAAERAASRLAAALPAPATPAPEAEGSKRIDTLESLLQDYIGERRRGEEAASSMLHTIEETLIRVLDRVDAMEAAGATSYARTDGNAPGQDGMDAESDRLAEAYASGARILGHKPSQPMLDAADYAPLLARQEKSLEPAAGGLDDATAEAIQTRHEPSAFAMRAKLKAQAAPEAPMSASWATDDTKADTGKRENAKASARARGSWSNMLFGGAMLVLFGVGYLAVDLFVAPGAMPARQQNPVAPTVEGQPATDSTQLKAEQGTADPQPGPQTGKSEAATPSPDDKEEPVQVPVPQPAKRPTRDTLTDDLGQGGPLRHLAAISTQALPGTVLQDIPLAAKDGAAPPGIDAMPPPGVGTAALRNAAANGDALAQLEVAARFAEGNGVAQDHKLAFAWYERAAMHGLAPAQFRLAAYYERGVGVAVDAERAKIWYRRAAEQGHVRAMHNLAVLVVGNGKDDADYAAAVRWFQQAADRGLTDSQFNLAVLYAHGRGVARDLAEAYKWFALAARSGDAGAARKLEEMKAQLELPEREAAEQKVAAWRAKPVESAANSAGR